MPSKSKKQQDFMAAVANNPKFAKKAGVPQSVGKDYEEADKMKRMKKYQAGGMSMKDMAMSKMGKQGYNDRLDESMGERNGPAMQGMKARRDESEGMEESMGKRKFAGDKAMKFQRGGAMPVGMANPRAGVMGGEMPMSASDAERQAADKELAASMGMAEARARRRAAGGAGRRGGGGRKAGGKIYKAGGSVRGAGCATKGVRKAKMVTMKGS
jgi:hypothetical protein